MHDNIPAIISLPLAATLWTVWAFMSFRRKKVNK